MNTPETAEEIAARARSFAESANTPLNSGHLLLAIITGNGVAANTLTLRGITETKIRAKLREDSQEPGDALHRIGLSAQQIASSVRSGSIGAIHLLAAITTVKDCRGFLILQQCEVNVDTIRVQSLRNMTSGLTREHGLRREKTQLQLTVQDSQKSGSTKVEAREDTSPRESVRKRVPVPVAKDMGRQLEQAQRKLRKSPALPPTPKKKGAAVPVETPFELSAKEFPILTSLGRNLTLEAMEGVLKPIVGRVAEIEQIADILNKKRANCPCLVGPPGVGKTAIVEGLACDMIFETIEGFRYEVVIEVSMAALLGGTTLRGELSDRIVEATREIQKSAGKVILFFDDVHSLLGSQDAAEAVTELKTALGRGDIPCIFATTWNEYEKHFDQALGRLTTTIEVTEPCQEEAVEILASVAPDYESHHEVQISMDALRAAVVLSTRYISDSYLPDKAISIIDLAASQVKRRGGTVVGENDVAVVLAHKLGVPEERLCASDAKRLLNLEAALSRDIIGHHHALEALGETLRRNAAGFRSGRPIGSFLFLGPTGVGKTETAKTLARLLFADEKAMIRLDMSEFSEAHAVAKLIGAPPGYIGHEDGGQLTDAVRKRPYSLVLLDEIEKAHRDVVQSLLQVLDDGRLTDGKGKTIDFKNTVIIMTSNLGSDLRQMETRKAPVGFGAVERSSESTISDTILKSARSALPPELWNRIDEPLVFAPLTSEDVSKIATLMLDRLATQIRREKEISLAIDENVTDHLIAAGGYDMQLGARPMRRTIARLIEGPLARIILGESQRGDTIRISVNNDALQIENTRMKPQRKSG